MSWWIFVVFIVVAIVAGLLYFFPNLFYPTIKTASLGPYPLNKVNSIFDNTNALDFQRLSSFTIQGFVYIVPLSRTPTAMTCNTPGNPSCEDGRFHRCDCGTSLECSKCDRTGYLPVIQVSNVAFLEVLPAPDAGRQGKAMTQLSLKTESNMGASGSSVDASGSRVDASGSRVDASGSRVDASGNGEVSSKYVEVLSLPAIPIQKWVMVTIVKEGRRYDVYYNDKLVLSKRTQFKLTLSPSQLGIVVGNPGLSGNAGAFTVYNTVQRGMDVAKAYKNMVDTRGAPYINLPADSYTRATAPAMPTFSTSLSGIGFNWSPCPSGQCFDTPKIRPAQPWLDWETSYA
jgi:hypothetical protein